MSLKPHHEYLLHCKKRLSGKRPRMTFVVGFHCFDGLVLCSDSEESDGLNKQYVDKLYYRKFPIDIGLCFGGDDEAIGIEKFRDAIFSLMDTDEGDAIKTVLTPEKVLEHMKTAYPDLPFSIILGQCNFKSGQTSLYRSYNRSPLRPQLNGDTIPVLDTILAWRTL